MKSVIIIAIAVVLLIPISAYATGHYQEAGTMNPEDAKALAEKMLLEDHSEVTIVTADGSGAPGCEETSTGCFIPGTVTVDVGGVIIMSNTDTVAHTFTSGTASDGPSGQFDTSLLMADQTFEYTADTAGEIPYFCMVHPWMTGLIIVQGTGAEEEMHDDSSEKDTSVSIRLEIDSKRYHMGDTLYLNGSISPADNSVYIQIINPTGEMIIKDRVTPSPSGIFNKNFKIAGSDWRHSGTFTLTVISGDSNEKERFVVLPKVEPPIIPDSSDKVTIETVAGSGAPGCEDTRAGCFIPSIASVELGGTVIFSNIDSAAHTFTAGTAADGPSGEFDTSLLMVNQSFQYTPRQEGPIPYFCMVHPWMTGLILVGDSGTFPPEPEPVEIDLDVSLNDRVFDLDDLVIIHVTLDGDVSKTIAIEVLDPRDTTVVSRSVHISANSSEAIEFRISEDFKTGNYKVIATTSHDGKTVSDTAFFKIKSQFNSFKITSVTVTNQKGSPSDLEAGGIGFIKVNLESSKSIATLVTVNIFDADLTSIGIGSVKTTLSSGNSEMILSFMIPVDVAVGPAEIYVNAFSDWPSNGGIPLTGEFSITELIRHPTPEPEPEPELAPTTSIIVQTYDSNYDEGDIVVISGNVSTILGEAPITLQLFVEGNLVAIAQITVAQDGSYSHTIIAEGPLWKKIGDYVVRVTYGEGNIAETEFSFTPKSESIETTTIFEVSVEGYGTFDVEYTIKGGTVKEMITDSNIHALIVRIESTDEGTISLDLPREFIGAEKQDGKDDTFIILIDGIEVAYQESVVHSDSRVITINFEEGDSNIQIIGTYVV